MCDSSKPDDDENDNDKRTTGMDERDIYYDVIDVHTGRITFRKDHPIYLTLKSALMGKGIDVDAVTTEDALFELEMTYHQYLFEFSRARALNRKSNSLESRMRKASLLGDYEEANRILALLRKRKQLGLKEVT